MKTQFKIGDTVAVIDDTIKGVVNNIEANVIIIETDDKFLLEYSESDLVLIKADQKELSKFIDISLDDFLEKEQSSVHKKSVKHQKKRQQPPMEVDLHIHHLIKSTKILAT